MTTTFSKPTQKLPPGPTGNILTGSYGDIGRDPLNFLLDVTRQYGDIVRYRFVIWHGFVVAHPEYVRHILQENHRNYSKRTFSYELLKPLVGEGILTSEGAHWLNQRRLMQPAFHRQRIAHFSEMMVEATLDMLERWDSNADQNQEMDIAAEMMRLTLGIVARALFGLEIGEEADVVGDNFTIANEAISNRSKFPLPFPLSWPLPANRRFQKAVAKLDEVVEEIIRRRREISNSGMPSGSASESQEDLLSILLQARDADTGEGMDDRQLRDEVMTLMLAGHETTATALAWTWHLLAQNPAVETRLRDELSDVLAGRPPTAADLQRLPYTRMVLDESMRLYPPAWVISRRAEKDDVIGGYNIPAGSIVLISPYITHRHPDFWENPETFDPERFRDEKTADRPSFAYFPFGGGPRLCIGRDFARVEAQLILATVAQRYRFEAVGGHPVEPAPWITLRPRYGIKMIPERID
jgi:cytochrome P450